ncbi:hypothetical protein PAXINDRAFT_19656 [Paxillus involutus ATCC 200175]|uniref:Uncharacterized protein n=1 Tax=Paxillus involutus ATCC 200175 TaxID=664439 RepID=A0A0C9TGN5_PAXIN|nr:hypothetical protein PAXINDRAFT_19656 [Paxillus involutus ATCC 200175]
MNRVIKLTHSDDASRLKDKIGHYVAPNAAEAAISPPFYIGGSSRSHLGLNHIVLARFLCPINKLHEFNIDPKRTQTKLLDGGIEIRSNIYPAFCWSGNPPASDFDEDDIYKGLHKGYLLERVMRHIFTGPSSALGEESRGTRAGNAELHGMTKVEAAHIAYACVQARFGITSTNRWSEKDGSFSYRRFYYHILDDIESNDDHAWKDAILRHHNVVLFRHENGRDAGSENHSDGNHDHGNPDSDPFLAKMRAQAAARASSTASGSKSSADSERRERSPTVITPPRSSPLLQREASPPASFLPQQRESSPPALSPPPPSPTPLSPVRHREVSPGPSRPKSSGLVPSGSELSDLDEDRETVTLKGKRRVQKGKKVSSDDDETNTAKDSGARKPQKQKRVSRSRKGRK